MTTLPDRVEAYARFAAADPNNVTWTISGALEEMERRDAPYTNIQTPPEWKSPYLVAFNVVKGDAVGMGLLEPLWNLSTTLEDEIPSEDIFLPDSPFDLLADLQDHREKVHELISHIRSSLRVSFRKKLAKRLEFLSEVAEEEAPDQADISAESLRMFIKFLKLAPDLKFPGVVLSPSGNVRVQWNAALNKHFVTEFYPDGEVRFVIFRPDSKHPDQTIRLSGIASVESLLNTVEPHGVLEWAGE